MKYTLLLLALFAVGCSGSPTAPSAPGTTPVAAAPTPAPVATVPPTPPNPLLQDPRYDAAFYRTFALGVGSGGPYGLIRQTQAPRIYLRTISEDGRAIDARTLDTAAAALINVAGSLTGVFGLAGMEQGTSGREGTPGWITVRWMVQADSGRCGEAFIGGDVIRLFLNAPNCGCNGSRMRPLTVKHELGHALGYYHTADARDLMSGIAVNACDLNPSAREVFHAQIAYGQPLGSTDPR